MWIIFQTTVSAYLLLIQFFFYREVTYRISRAPHPDRNKKIVNALFLLFNIPVILLLALSREMRHLPGWVITSAVLPLYLWHASAVLVFFAIVLKEAVLFPVRAVRWAVRRFETPEHHPVPVPRATETAFDPQRRVFLGRGMTVVAGAAFVGSAIGAFGKDNYAFSDIPVPIANLPEEFEGFTIAFVSDIHSSVFMTRETMKGYASVINAMKSDCIIIAGDFVNSMAEEVYPFAEAFSELKAPFGVYGVLGNHDYYTRNVELVAREVVAGGIKLLVNDRVDFQKGGAKIHLMGVDDTGNRRRAAQLFDQVARGTFEGTPKILMCHRPYYFEEAARRSFDLTLAGHTHGGQIVLARIGNEVIAPARMASPYVAGLYSIGSSRMYVSRGIGTVGIPVRINCPPEITKIRLVRGLPPAVPPAPER
jgi:predicted MPP superfamily phosphohydrolase